MSAQGRSQSEDRKSSESPSTGGRPYIPDLEMQSSRFKPVIDGVWRSSAFPVHMVAFERQGVAMSIGYRVLSREQIAININPQACVPVCHLLILHYA